MRRGPDDELETKERRQTQHAPDAHHLEVPPVVGAAPLALGPHPSEHRAQEREREPRPEREVVEPHVGEDGMGLHPRAEEGLRQREARVDPERRGQQRPARGARAQQWQERRHPDDREADRLEHPAGEQRLVGEHEQVQEPARDDELRAAPDVLPRDRRVALAAGERRVEERERHAEAGEEQEDRRGEGHGEVDQVIPRPAHRALDPPPARVVQDHEDEGQAAEAVQEELSSRCRCRHRRYSTLEHPPAPSARRARVPDRAPSGRQLSGDTPRATPAPRRSIRPRRDARPGPGRC